MNARFLPIASFLLAAPMVMAQQPAPTPDVATPPPPHHQIREVREIRMQGPMDRGHEGGAMGEDHSMGGMHHEMHGGSRPGKPHGDWWKNPELVTRLALTPDQVKRLDEISIKGKLDAIHLHAALEEDEVLMKPLVEGTAFDEHKADAQIDKIADARAALEKARAKNMLSMHAVLTPDQWSKLHKPEPNKMMHHGMSHGGRPMGEGSHGMGMDEGGPVPASEAPQAQPSM